MNAAQTVAWAFSERRGVWQGQGLADAAALQGAESPPPWAGLNLGDHVGDDVDRVTAHRRRWAQALGVRPVFLKQVHGRQVQRLALDSQDGLEADAAVTDQWGVACTVLVADCLPVLLARADGSAVGAAHAGWRGLAGGVLEATVAALNALPPGPGGVSAPVWARLGPCIGPQRFEVGEDVRQAFADEPALCRPDPQGRPGKYLADLPALARARLAALGVVVWGDSPPCTVLGGERFFSHRRDGVTGRLAASIWRLPRQAGPFSG